MKKMNLFLITIIGILSFNAYSVQGFPDSRNPNLEYELISGGPQVVQPTPKPTFIPITRKPMVINTPPPVNPNSKTFAYDPIAKTWTSVKKTDPIPAEGTLLWNQSNDKWLTNIPSA